MQEIYFTSDTHFGHANIIRYCERPFKDVVHMNEAMIENWNSRVKPGDLVYHLGDFALKMSQTEVETILRRLNGEVHLILGNHDMKNKSVLRARGFAEQLPYKELKDGDLRIVLCHFPFLTWNKSHKGSWDLHGHCHGNLKNPKCPFCEKTSEKRTARRLDVGVDCWNFRPITLAEVKSEMDRVEFAPVDHHDEEGQDL